MAQAARAAQAAHYGYKAYQGFKLGLAVIDMGTTLVQVFQTGDIVIRKKMLEALWDKHKAEFDIMNKAGELMNKLTGTTSLRNQIQKAKISSIQNWSTIALELDRNTALIQKIATHLKGTQKSIEDSTKIGGKAWIGFGLLMGGAGISAYMLKKQAPKTWQKMWAPNPNKMNNPAASGKLKMQNALSRMKVLKTRGFQFDSVEGMVKAEKSWKNMAYGGLKWSGKLAMRGFQVLKCVMSIWGIIQSTKAIQQLKEQYNSLQKYYQGENSEKSFVEDIKAVCQSLTNIALDLDYLHSASIAIIQDFNKIFTLQYALAVTKPDRFRQLAEEYDPQKLQFGQEICEQTAKNAEEMAKIYDNKDLEQKKKMENLYTILEKFITKSDPKKRIVNFTTKLSKDISHFIQHEQIWQRHDRYVTFHEKALGIISDFKDKYCKPIANECAVMDAGEKAYNQAQQKLTGAQFDELCDLIKNKESITDDEKIERRIELRCQAEINEIAQIKLKKYLQKVKGSDKLHRQVLDDLVNQYKNTFGNKFDHDDECHIALQLINFFDAFYATDTTGKTIYGINIAEHKEKETYATSFQKFQSRSNFIPIHKKDENNIKEFEEIFERTASQNLKAKIAKKQLDLRFLRISQQTETTKKDGKDVQQNTLHTSNGWRIRLYLKDGTNDPVYYYLEKDRKKPTWELYSHNELMDEEKKANKVAQENEKEE